MLPVSPAPIPASTSSPNSRAFTPARSRSSTSRLSHAAEGQTAAVPVRLLVVPYDSGHRDARMGAGPLALVRAGAADLLGADAVRVLEPTGSWRAELATAFQLHRLVAAEVAGAVDAGQVPLLLAGNCNATLGVLAGLSAAGQRVGLLWLDAHGDF